MSSLHPVAVRLVALALLAAPGTAAQTLLRSPVVAGAEGSNFSALDLAVADVNGDGHPDIVTTTASETRLVLGTPDGPYGANLPFLGGGGLYACQLADLDGDGRADAARAPSTGGVLVQRNLGGGAFGPVQSLSTTSPVSTLCFADLDDDEDLDLVVGLYGQQRITIFLGDGAGGLLPGVDEPAPLSVMRIATGDLDGDGILDLAVHNHRAYLVDDAQAFVLRGTGGGAFANPVLLHSDVIDIAVADFTDDGLADVAVTEASGDIVVHAGDPLLSLPAVFSLPALGHWPNLATGDLDADGRADLVQIPGNQLAGHLQAPGGGLGAAIGGACPSSTSPPVVLADLDRDGRLDAATLQANFGTVGAIFGNGDGSWRTRSFAPPPDSGIGDADAEIADFDADGRLDLLQIFAGQVPALLHRGALDGSFAPQEPLDLGPDVLRVFVDDSNQDGNLDLVVVRTTPFATPQGGVALAVGDGRFGFALSPDVPPQSKIHDARPADVNLDGRTDVLALESGRVQVLLNAGDGSFPTLTTITTSAPSDVDAADLDHDGDLDFVVSSEGEFTSFIKVYEQDAGSFSQTGNLSMSGRLRDLLLHDLDGDGNVDALGAAYLASADNNLLLRHGASDGSFGSLQTIPMPGTRDVRALSLAELDGDPESELLVGCGTNSANGDVLVFDLVGGAPVLAETHTSGMSSTRLVSADINGDAHQDVLVVCYFSVYTIMNTTGPWTRLAYPISGTAGDALLAGEGTLLPGSPLRVSIVGMKPLTSTVLVVGIAELNAPFKGGVFVPTPNLLIPGLPTDADGNRTLSTTWPAGLTSGFDVVMQAWQADGAAPAGFASTNGLRGEVP